jgi:hypothetical protein
MIPIHWLDEDDNETRFDVEITSYYPGLRETLYDPPEPEEVRYSIYQAGVELHELDDEIAEHIHQQVLSELPTWLEERKYGGRY